MIVDGGGYKDGALAWLKDAVQEKKYQNNLAETGSNSLFQAHLWIGIYSEPLHWIFVHVWQHLWDNSYWRDCNRRDGIHQVKRFFMSENEIILIVDGGGYKDGALAWLKDAVQEKKYQNNLAKKIRVFSLVDFLTWAPATCCHLHSIRISRFSPLLFKRNSVFPLWP
jgi:hypothetical protein